MKKIIFGLSLIFLNLAFASSGSVGELENAPEVRARLKVLSELGWKKFGESSLSTINSFHYSSGSQGKTLLLIVPIYGSRYLRFSCVAAVFDRGGSSDYHFKEFTQIGGYCE